MLSMRANILKSYKSVLNNNYILIYLIYFSFFLFNGPFEKIIPLTFEEIRFNEKLYGLFLSINNVVHIILPGFIAYIANKFNSFKIAIIAMLLSIIGAIGVGILPEYYLYIFPFALLIICGRTIFNYSLGNSINYILPDNNRGKYFAMRDLFLFGAISLGLFLGGIYTNNFGIRALYITFSLGFLIPLFLIILAKRRLASLIEKGKQGEEDEKEESKDDIKTRRINKTVIYELLRDKKVWAFIIIQIGTTIYTSAMSFLPLLGTSIGISVANVMAMFGAVTIINSILALLLGHFSDLSGRKWIYVIDLGFDVFPAIVFAFTNNITLFIVGIVLIMIKDALAPISFAYYFDCFPEEKGTLIMGILSSLGNALSFIAPIIVGILWVSSAKYVFLFGALGNGLSALVAIFMLPDIRKDKTLAA